MTSRAVLPAILISLLLSAPSNAAGTKPAPGAPAAIVLCYHIVESPQDPRMEISRDAFRQQMRYLSMTGYHVIPLRHLYEYVTGKRATIPNNAVVITIDDGWRSTYTEVFPEMQRWKFPFTVFVYPKIIGQTSHALNWKQVKEMADAGVDIQSHTLSHGYLTRRRHASLDPKSYGEWLQHELSESKRLLESETGRQVDFLAYPYGDYDHNVARSAAEAGYDAALTCEYGSVRHGSDPLRMKRFVVDKRMDFAQFRHYLGAGSLPLEGVTPPPNQVVEPEQPLVISAKIPNYKSLDPKSIGMALLSMQSVQPFSYDARDGSITMVISGAVDALKGRYQRALIWAKEAKTGKRVEATWTFRLPDAAAPPVATPAIQPPIGTPASDPGIEMQKRSGEANLREAREAAIAAVSGGGRSTGERPEARPILQRSPK